MTGLSLPPLLRGIETLDPPWTRACGEAATGQAEPGDLYWSPRGDAMRAAVALAPDRSLADAMPAVFAMACGLHDCLGALAPPETAVHHQWPDTVLVNDAVCGILRVAAPAGALEATPSWMVAAVDLALAPIAGDPGANPGVTSMAEEGWLVEDVRTLIESWARHLLVWIHRWQEDGVRPLHDAWLPRARGRGEEAAVRHAGGVERGVLLGLDERGDLLLRDGGGVRQLSLSAILEHPAAWPLEALP